MLEGARGSNGLNSAEFKRPPERHSESCIDLLVLTLLFELDERITVIVRRSVEDSNLPQKAISDIVMVGGRLAYSVHQLGVEG